MTLSTYYLASQKTGQDRSRHYSQITFLSSLYELFTRVITTRLEKKLDVPQPNEQAGFRSRFRTNESLTL